MDGPCDLLRQQLVDASVPREKSLARELLCDDAQPKVRLRPWGHVVHRAFVDDLEMRGRESFFELCVNVLLQGQGGCLREPPIVPKTGLGRC